MELHNSRPPTLSECDSNWDTLQGLQGNIHVVPITAAVVLKIVTINFKSDAVIVKEGESVSLCRGWVNVACPSGTQVAASVCLGDPVLPVVINIRFEPGVEGWT